MKTLYAIVLIGLMSATAFAQENQTKNQGENPAVVAKMQMLQKAITEKALTAESIEASSARRVPKQSNKSSNEKAISGSFEVAQGSTTHVKNSFVYKII